MALNIRPFQFDYQPIKAGPVQPIMGGDWGPKDMSKQLQEGIAGILPQLAQSYQAVNKQRQMELQGADLMAQKAQQAGQAYTSGTAAGGGPITADNASPQSSYQQKFTPELEDLFQKKSQETGVPVEYYKKVAGIESAGQLNIKNPNSSAQGLFQFTDGTWKQYGTGDRTTAQAQFDAMGKLTLDNQAQLRSALGRDPTPGELYLAHQQGAGGAKALLSNPTGNVVDVLTDVYGGNRDKATQAVKLNGGNVNMNAQQFAGRWVGSQGMGSTMGAPPTVVSSSVVKPGDTVAPGASAVSSGGLTDPVMAYKTRLQEMYPQIRVTSEFRSQAQNQKVGGVGGSQHLSGNALDVDVSGMSEEQKQAFVNDAISNGAKGIGWYNNRSMHIDFRQNPAAWGPNKSYSSIGQTPKWFQEAAAKLKGGSVNAAASPVPAAGAPAQVASASPGVVTQTPATQHATPGGQNQQPLFATPALQSATQGGGPGGQMPPAGQQPIPPQPQQQNPQTQLAGAPPPAPPPAIPPTPPNIPMHAPPPPQPAVPGTAGMVAGPGVPASAPPPPPDQGGGLSFGNVLAVPNLSSETKAYFAQLAQTQGGEQAPLNPRAIIMDAKAPPEAKALAQNLLENPPKPPPPPPITSAPVKPGQAAPVPPRVAQAVAAAEGATPAPNLPTVASGAPDAVGPDVPLAPPPPAPQAAGAANPTIGPAGVQTKPNVAPAPPAPVTPAPAQPARQADPTTTGSVASRRDMPAGVQATLAQAGVRDPSAVDPLSLRMLGRAFMTGDPAVVQATTNAINALTAQRNAGDSAWTYHKDSKTGQEIRFNSKTGERQIIEAGKPGATPSDLILAPKDPRRANYPGIPDDNRTYRVHPTSDSIDITPLDERESKTFEQEQHLADKFEQNDVVKKYRGMEQGIAAVGSAFKSGTPESDMLGIIEMFKTMDPTSTVSAGETANAENAPGVDERVRSLYNRWMEGGGKFTATTRQNFYNGLRGILESQRAQADSIATGTANTAKGYNLDPVRTMERWKPGEVPKPVTDPNVFANRKADGTIKTSAEEEAEANQPGANRMKPIVQEQSYPDAKTAVDAAEDVLRQQGRTWGYVTIRVEGKKPVTRFVGERLDN